MAYDHIATSSHIVVYCIITNELAHRGLQFLKRETVLCAAVLLAVISCFFVAPGLSYLSYIDWNTLALLFSLMAVMKGLQQANFFICLADILLRRVRTTRALLFLLIFLPFVFSMVITNDVALIAFVPFGLTVLHLVDQDRLAVPQVVLQTLVASMASLISYKLLVQEYPQQRMRYLGLFTFLNLLFLGLLYTMSVILRS